MARISNSDSFQIESSGVLSEKSFGIKDMGFILHLLRSKIYSNIKLAVCREYLCNARDAHREIGEFNKPIQVTLPTFLDPNYRVRDFGPGISPERIENVFINYGASTKRDSDIQLGCMGIGAKSSFGYTDSFIINTFIDGIHRSYNAVVDESRCGKLVLLSQTKTEQPTGTEIVVPIQQQDFRDFANETFNVCKHWDVKPIVKGTHIDFDSFLKGQRILEGKDWFFAKANHGSRMLFVIVDGIEYHYDLKWFDYNSIPQFSYGTSLYLKVPTGAVNIAANRESIEVDATSKNKISELFKVVTAECKEKFESEIKHCKTFVEANVRAHEMCSGLGFCMPKDMEWNGAKLVGNAVNVSGVQAVSYSSWVPDKIRKDSRWPSSHIALSTDAVYCIVTHDFNSIVERGALAILKEFPDMKRVYMIRFDGPNGKTEFDKLNLSLLNPVKFEDYYTPKTKRSSLGRMTFYKLNGSRFSRSSFKDYEEENNKKVWCLLKKENEWGQDNGPLAIINNKTVYSGSLERFMKNNLSDYVVYGFMYDTSEEKLEDATEYMDGKLETIVNELLETKDINLEEVKFVQTTNTETNQLFHTSDEEEFYKAFNHVSNQDSSLIEYLKASKECRAKSQTLKTFTFLVEKNNDVIKTKDYTKPLAALSTKVLNDYPLLSFLNKKSGGRAPTSTALVHYVNQVDGAKIILNS